MILINILILLYSQLNVVKAITLNALGFSFMEESQFYTVITKDFNDYAEKNNLDIKIDFNVLAPSNSTKSVNDFKSVLDTMHHKHSTKYDIIFYKLSSDLKNFDRYFLDYNKWLPEEHIKMYDPEVLSTRCTVNNTLVGLPMTLTYTVLYYHKILLDRYEKRAPKTWEELIETSLEIKEKEKKLGNIHLSEFNGLFSEKNAESYFEFIYSFRNSTDSPYPEVNSKETRDAFEMIMKMKNKLSSGTEFNLLETSTVKKIEEGSSIFLKFWIAAEPFASKAKKFYSLAPLPGGKEGISAASVNGYNVGINSLIENLDERRDAALEVIKFITSKEMQKHYFINGIIVPAIPSLYDDEEVCKINDCELYNNLQRLLDTPHDFYDQDKYEEKYGKLATSYIFKNNDLSSVLNKIEDITKIYYVSLGSDNYYIGLIIVILVPLFSTLMYLSLIFTFIKKFKPFFLNLSIDSWFLLITGFVFILCTALTNIGILSVTKCHLKIALNSMGMTLYLIILLYELIINFPKENKYCKWIKKHKYFYFAFFILIDITFNRLSMIKPYSISNKIIEDRHNYQICEMTNYFGKSMIYSMIIAKAIIFIVISYLIFMEWNSKKIFYEVRFIFMALYSNLLLAFISVIVGMTQINSFAHFVIQEFIIIFMSVSSYIFLYGYRLYLAFTNKKKKNLKLKFPNDVYKSVTIKSNIENKQNITNISIIGDNSTHIASDYDNRTNIEQMIESSPSPLFVNTNYHNLKEHDNNFTTNF